MRVTVPLVKNISALLGTKEAASANDAGIQKKIHGSGTTTLIVSNKEMNHTMKVAQALGDSNFVLKGVIETNKDETKEQKGGFQGTLVGTLGLILMGNLLSGKGIVSSYNVEWIVRAGYGRELDF